MTAESERTAREAADAAASRNGHRPVVLEAVRGDLSTIRRTRWAWRGWAPLGSFLLIAGEPGAGKGVFTCWLLANLTCGTAPGDLEGEPVNIMWVGFEDSWEEVVLPRLTAANADVERIHRLRVANSDQSLELARDRDQLGALVIKHDLRAIAFEAIVDHLAGDDHKNKEVRRELAPLVGLARERALLAIGTTHLNKERGGSYRQRVAGSGGYLAVARVGLLVHPHPDDPELSTLSLGKGNLGRVPDPMVFAIGGSLVHNPTNEEVADVGVVAANPEPYFDRTLTVDDILAGPKTDRGSKEDDVVDFLTAFLRDGPRPSAEVLKAGADHGLGEKTLRKHRDAASAEVYQRDRGWWWRLKGGAG